MKYIFWLLCIVAAIVLLSVFHLWGKVLWVIIFIGAFLLIAIGGGDAVDDWF